MEQRRDGKMARNNRKQTFIICKNCGKSFHPISGHLKQETCGYDCAIALRVIRGSTVKNTGWNDFLELNRIASDYIKKLGGFEKLAEWGLV